MSNATAPGSFCWFELGTTDPEAAKRFYSGLFGWTADDVPMGPAGVYTIFRLGGREAGATYALPPDQLAHGIPPNWLVYVKVESADASAARAASLGANVGVKPFDVM